MRHLFIINPAAGKKDSTQRLLDQIKAVFPDGAEVAFTQTAGDATQLAAQAAQSGAQVRIYACGGDGTLNEVVNGAAGWANAAVTNVPKGTGNDFLRLFGPNAARAFSDLAALRDGPQTQVDLIACNERLGIDIVCAGVDAWVAADIPRFKALPLVSGTGAYLLALVLHMCKGISRPMTVEMGPIRYSGGVTILCVCNGRYYGGGFMPMGDAQPDDGVLDMLLVPKVKRATFVRLLGAYARGRYKSYPEIIWDYHGQSATISAPHELVAVVDGEPMRSKQFTIRLSEKKIAFFYPAGMFWR
ncbi:MAG: YegS/Rv2252/BmrU family lipid kinase [Oscillospiraceae bacterium]|nr:YegS/Rv2252/BmrU family lipid kinase [Oscillospiraceae bacterium]